MPYRPHRRTMADEPIHIGDDAPQLKYKSPAPQIVVAVWCDLVATMDRVRLNAFTRDIWRRFDRNDLTQLQYAIIRRRRELALAAWP